MCQEQSTLRGWVESLILAAPKDNARPCQDTANVLGLSESRQPSWPGKTAIQTQITTDIRNHRLRSQFVAHYSPRYCISTCETCQRLTYEGIALSTCSVTWARYSQIKKRESRWKLPPCRIYQGANSEPTSLSPSPSCLVDEPCLSGALSGHGNAFNPFKNFVLSRMGSSQLEVFA